MNTPPDEPAFSRQHHGSYPQAGGVARDSAEPRLHANGSERDPRPHVIKRKIFGGTRSDQGRDCRDAFLGLLLTCAKLGLLIDGEGNFKELFESIEEDQIQRGVIGGA